MCITTRGTYFLPASSRFDDFLLEGSHMLLFGKLEFLRLSHLDTLTMC